MKKLLFLLTLGLGAAQVQAQTQMRAVLPVDAQMPAAVRQALAKHGVVLAPAATRSSTIRKPGKTTVYAWDYPGNRWAEQARVELTTYNAQGLRTQLVEQDSATQRPTERISWTYNADGLSTGHLEESWDGTAWQNQARSLSVYNSADFQTEYLEQRWTNGAWQNVVRSMIQYDARNHYVGYQLEEWKNNAWALTAAGRGTVVYNTAGQVLEETEEYLDTSLNIYRRSLRRQYTYPSLTSLNYSELILQAWEPTANAYENRQRVANIVRDAQGRETSSEEGLWVNGAWELSSRFSATFSLNGGTTGLYEQRVNNAWVNQVRYTYSYDAFGNDLGYVSETWSNNAWTPAENSYRYLARYNAANDLTGRVRQNYNTTTKVYDNALKYTYGDFQSITLGMKPNAVLAAQTQLYPNPTSSTATIELSGLANQPIPAEVLNSLGQVVQRLTLHPQQGQLRQPLELSQLPGGIYTVRLHTSAGLVVKKLFKK